MAEIAGGSNFSVIICGGSLAGLACAIRLKQLGIDALVLEKSKFPREKLCGEFLGPDAVECLDMLGILDLVRFYAYGPVDTIHFYNSQAEQIKIQTNWFKKSHPFGLAIPRSQLDFLLLEVARKAGIDIQEESRVLTWHNESKGFRLVVEEKAQIKNYGCQFFVDASGRNTGFIRNTSASQNNMVGMQCHAMLPDANRSKDLEMFLFEGGYGGIQPIGEKSINICMLIRPELAKHSKNGMDSLLDKTIKKNLAASRLLCGIHLEGKIHSTLVTNLNIGSLKRPLLQIGDALVTIDPFFGIGMAHALRSGYLSASYLQEGLLKEHTYSQVTQSYYRAYKKIYGNRLKLAQLLRPALMSNFAQKAFWPVLSPFLPLLSRACQ